MGHASWSGGCDVNGGSVDIAKHEVLVKSFMFESVLNSFIALSRCIKKLHTELIATNNVIIFLSEYWVHFLS